MTDALFLRACRGEKTERPPLWIMRQAGRYLPEYRELRRSTDFLTLCRTPELAARVTLQPIDRFGFDAAILFSDILVPAAALGVRFDFNPGPVLDDPIRTPAQIDALRVGEPESAVPYVFETVRILRRELADRVPLIGFAAAPLTFAVYLVEGGGSKNFDRIKRLLFGDPRAAHGLLEKVAELTERYLRAQIQAGAQAVQLFDTWAGLFDPACYREFGLRYARRVLDGLAPAGVPRIYFALDASHLLEQVGESGADVIGADWRVPLDVVSDRLGRRFPLQGNLDPCVLLTTPQIVGRRVGQLLDGARDLPGHIFNLGHGVLPATPVENVEALVEAVRAAGRARG
ncbi:MAG TPA: uroporphyrinogen decarboxylase [Candidatus Polarisedimenticolaceae bacterium]|nr:uroporphyrinogen decarboxylase [Candidatus Polarisedimenticolaceae bacterium]